MKNVTIFHKTVETDVDPRLIMTLKYRKIKFKPRINWTTTTYTVVHVRLACSRRSDSRAREKNSRRKIKKKRGVQLNSLPTYRRTLLSERLEDEANVRQTFVNDHLP